MLAALTAVLPSSAGTLTWGIYKLLTGNAKCIEIIVTKQNEKQQQQQQIPHEVCILKLD